LAKNPETVQIVVGCDGGGTVSSFVLLSDAIDLSKSTGVEIEDSEGSEMSHTSIEDSDISGYVNQVM
jgi:hypothetical protein